MTFEGLSIGNLPAQIPPPLQDLIDLISEGSAELVNQVIDLLSSVAGNTIEIPGLGSIGLAGVKSGRANANAAWSQTAALKLTITATGHPTTLTLGRARTAVSSPPTTCRAWSRAGSSRAWAVAAWCPRRWPWSPTSTPRSAAAHGR